MNKKLFDSGIKLEAVRLRDCWAVRPEGAIGTHGNTNGVPWTVMYVRSSTADQAIDKAWRMFYE